jgi:hypothetical protein
MGLSLASIPHNKGGIMAALAFLSGVPEARTINTVALQ